MLETPLRPGDLLRGLQSPEWEKSRSCSVYCTDLLGIIASSSHSGAAEAELHFRTPPLGLFPCEGSCLIPELSLSAPFPLSSFMAEASGNC